MEVTDGNGCSSTSDIYPFVFTGIATSGEPMVVNVFPNPGSGVFMITIPDAGQRETQVSVMDHSGRVILREQMSASSNKPVRVDLSTHPSGIYFVVVRSETSVWYGKLVKGR